jgi:hypothetical protein
MLASRFRAIRHDPAVREAFFVFVLTRAAIIALFVVTQATVPHRGSPLSDEDPHVSTTVRPPEIIAKLEHGLGRGDSAWYVQIARDGYDRVTFSNERQHNWVFFPLYPLVLASVASWSGAYLLSGAAISNLLFLIALVLLHKLVTQLGYDRATADRTLFYSAAFPAGYFFSLPLPESLYLCLVVATFLAAAR